VNDPQQDFLLNLLAYAVIAVPALAIAVALYTLVPSVRHRLFPLPRVRRGHWNGIEVFFALIALPFAQVTASGVLRESPLAPENAEVDPSVGVRLAVWSSPLSTALTLAIVFTLLYAISRTRPHQYGLSWARWPANALLGILLWLVMAPVTLAAYLAVLQFFPAEPNPLEILVERGIVPWEGGLLVFMTVVGAPLTEEVLFRGVMQGWLWRATLFGHIVVMLAILLIGSLPPVLYVAAQFAEGPEQEALRAAAPGDLLSAVTPLAFSGLLVVGYVAAMVILALRFQDGGVDVARWRLQMVVTERLGDPLHGDGIVEGLPPITEKFAGEAERRREHWQWANVHLAVFGSAALFGLMHGWPQSVPLVVLGTALGWLAYRTQSLVGPIVCHGLFNAVACLALYWTPVGG
jgi:membrane protease YdiL (CAAX protease family)